MTTNRICLEANTSLSAELTDRMMQDLLALNEQATNSEFVLTVRDDTNQITGGLIASTSYGWMLIKVLWVDQKNRRHGLGKELMESAIKRGRELGCHGAWLDTSSLQAHAFYINQGFEVFGILNNEPHQYPKAHQRWLMRKQINS